jgi:hypothetical protein
MDLLQALEYAAKLAPLMTAGIACSAFAVGYAQLRTTKRLHSENNARAVWREYEVLAMKNPQFHGIRKSQLDFGALTLNGDKDQFTSYGWYVSFMCLACEAVLIGFRRQSDWAESVRMQLAFHRAFLFSDWFERNGWAPSFDMNFRNLFEIERANSRASRKTA